MFWISGSLEHRTYFSISMIIKTIIIKLLLVKLKVLRMKGPWVGRMEKTGKKRFPALPDTKPSVSMVVYGTPSTHTLNVPLHTLMPFIPPLWPSLRIPWTYSPPLNRAVKSPHDNYLLASLFPSLVWIPWEQQFSSTCVPSTWHSTSQMVSTQCELHWITHTPHGQQYYFKRVRSAPFSKTISFSIPSHTCSHLLSFWALG